MIGRNQEIEQLNRLYNSNQFEFLVMYRNKTEAIFCECKFTNREMLMSEYDDLLTAAQGFSDKIQKHFIFISKSGYTATVQKRAKEGFLTVSENMNNHDKIHIKS